MVNAYDVELAIRRKDKSEPDRCVTRREYGHEPLDACKIALLNQFLEMAAVSDQYQIDFVRVTVSRDEIDKRVTALTAEIENFTKKLRVGGAAVEATLAKYPERKRS